MIVLPGKSGVVYRRGRPTPTNFTPRPTLDTTGRPGQAPGLSTLATLSLGKGDIAQEIDLALLQPPLSAWPDDPKQGGTPGHTAIAPADAAGNVDQPRLEAWAAARGQLPVHPLTEMALKAIVAEHVGV